ncbi:MULTISPECIES: nuclear transport factor 2 family protein [Burkholderia cepacia complex]|uniref:nuclear transport factor 2 family protein n=1 Tax=Burkholderia cepacia complex TaxID=87882 RepID=UPI001CF23441|nr:MULTISPECIES: nuclear transport factor 2 family protein [Burkholderia cepacia complex]MCA8057362.1 ester cyclase [Burkholderia cepacia]MDN7535187.1 ester cyclase [Burkholderia orbicola]
MKNANFPDYLCAQPQHTSEQSAKLKLVLDFYKNVVVGLDFSDTTRYVREPYVQHNPLVGDGMENLRTFATQVADMTPEGSVTMHRAFVDGDYVITHSEVTFAPGDTKAVFDLFKVIDGRIVEHWDAIQDVPAIARNGRSMF